MLEDGLDDQPPAGSGYDDAHLSGADLDRPPAPPDDWPETDDDWRAWETAELQRECAQADAWEAERQAELRERAPPG